MTSTSEKHRHEEWKKTTAIACIVATLDIGVLFVGLSTDTSENTPNLGLTIALIGIITFFGMLIISSYFAIHNPERRGIMRRAITGSMITVYVVILSLSMTGKLEPENEISMALLQNFAYVIITIIGFYFGSKGVKEFKKFWDSTKNSSQNEKKQD